MHKKSIAQSKSAFTLIELLVSVAIFGILSLLIAQFLVNFMNMKFNTETRQRIRQEGNYALDRIEFLVRNSVTLPELCVYPKEGRLVPLDSDQSIKAGDILKVNTQVPGEYSFQRNQVKILVPNNNKKELVLMMRTDSTKHNSGNFWNQPDNIINLTSNTVGSSGNISLKVENVTGEKLFTCSNQTFTVGTSPNQVTINRGFVVKISFTITYDRKTFGSNSAPIIEKFEREVAVVNTNPFED